MSTVMFLGIITLTVAQDCNVGKSFVDLSSKHGSSSVFASFAQQTTLTVNIPNGLSSVITFEQDFKCNKQISSIQLSFDYILTKPDLELLNADVQLLISVTGPPVIPTLGRPQLPSPILYNGNVDLNVCGDGSLSSFDTDEQHVNAVPDISTGQNRFNVRLIFQQRLTGYGMDILVQSIRLKITYRDGSIAKLRGKCYNDKDCIGDSICSINSGKCKDENTHCFEGYADQFRSAAHSFTNEEKILFGNKIHNDEIELFGIRWRISELILLGLMISIHIFGIVGVYICYQKGIFSNSENTIAKYSMVSLESESDVL